MKTFPLVLILFVFIGTSCSHFHIEKRKYRKGFYVEHGKSGNRFHVKSTNHELDLMEGVAEKAEFETIEELSNENQEFKIETHPTPVLSETFSITEIPSSTDASISEPIHPNGASEQQVFTEQQYEPKMNNYRKSAKGTIYYLVFLVYAIVLIVVLMLAWLVSIIFGGTFGVGVLVIIGGIWLICLLITLLLLASFGV
jgi:hypothetical protein